MSIQRNKSDGTWKLMAYGFLTSVGAMLLIQMLIRFGACK
jgi:hypothetical protein